MIPWLNQDTEFPPVESALESPNGLLAAGGDLTPQRLLAAYRKGIFPWYSAGDPILWWSPDPRMVLIPTELKVSRSLAKTLRNRDYTIRFDSRFSAVMEACGASRPGQAGTWINPDMCAAYGTLHRMGYAHSAETWIDGSLAGGLYGIAIGRAFFGESMFSFERDASKIALVALIQLLRNQDFGLIDCQMHTSHLASLGARDIPRQQFSGLLRKLVDSPCTPGSWAQIPTALDFPRPPPRSCQN